MTSRATSYDLVAIATGTHDVRGAGHDAGVTTPPVPTGWVALTLQGSVMTSNLIPPKVWMNGHPVPASYGENPVPVHPGRIRVDVRCQWVREYGQATLDIDVAPGQTVPVFYAAPLHQFTRGAIGHVRQPRPGVVGLLVTIGIVLAVVVAIVAAAVLAV